jgi:hypothetical protein
MPLTKRIHSLDKKPIHGVDEPHSGVEQLRVSDTFIVRAYYTSHGGRLVRLRIANDFHYDSR